MAKNNAPLSPREIATLQRINRKLSLCVHNFEANRDAVTGIFKTGSAVTPKALRSAWGLNTPSNSSRALFKAQLLAALRAKRQ